MLLPVCFTSLFTDVTPQLVPLYRASEEYDLVDLSPASWLDLTYR